MVIVVAIIGEIDLEAGSAANNAPALQRAANGGAGQQWLKLLVGELVR